MHTFMHAWIYIYIHACVCMCMYMQTYTYMYMHMYHIKSTLYIYQLNEVSAKSIFLRTIIQVKSWFKRQRPNHLLRHNVVTNDWKDIVSEETDKDIVSEQVDKAPCPTSLIGGRLSLVTSWSTWLMLKPNLQQFRTQWKQLRYLQSTF